MRIRMSGDTMLIVELGDRIDETINAHAIALAERLASAQLPGVRDVVPGYTTVGIHVDPLRTEWPALEHAIVGAAGDVETAPVAERPVIEIAVEYGGAHGPDLDEVARFAGCTADEVIARHASRVYRVYMLGFVPGFAYMGRVDPSIAAPRHRVPRERVPAGSVGIAGEQTGVYPIASPGGWQLVGRTQARMFDPNRMPASLVAPGDRVRFVRVEPARP
jgi:KipI family sensor histidine kinase inhibitor